MEKTYADGYDLEDLRIGKNNSNDMPIIYNRVRTLEDIEEDDRILEIAKNVGLTEGENMIEGIPEKEMMELSKYDDPISVWISRKRLREIDKETFY